MNASSNKIRGAAVALFTFTVLPLAAQTGHGFLNLVNLVPEKNCDVRIGAVNAMPGGLKPGTSTGWFIVPAGSHSLALGVEGLRDASGTMTVADGQSAVGVIFLEAPREVDEDEGPAKPRIRFQRCEVLPVAKGFSLQLLSFCPGGSEFRIADKPFVVEFRKSLEIPGWGGGAFKLYRNGKAVGEIPTEHEKGSFYLMVGTNHSGSYCSTLVRAEAQTLPPWMKEERKSGPP